MQIRKSTNIICFNNYPISTKKTILFRASSTFCQDIVSVVFVYIRHDRFRTCKLPELLRMGEGVVFNLDNY